MNENVLLRKLHISWRKTILVKATVLCFAQSQREAFGVFCFCFVGVFVSVHEYLQVQILYVNVMVLLAVFIYTLSFSQ